MRMVWEKACTSSANLKDLEGRSGGVVGREGGEGGLMYVRVMTDEQMEILRRQISVYATICEQLVEMHKAFTAQQDSLAGMRLGGLYSDPSMMSPGGHKISGRQRWTPTIGQLQILERIFDQGNGAPSKQKIKEMTSELAQHGQISETNVYNWFQNRRARSKRKQTAALPSYTESETEVEVESPREKRARPERIHSHESQPPRMEDSLLQSPEVSSQEPEPVRTRGTFSSNDDSKSSGNPIQMSFFESAGIESVGGEDGNHRGGYYFSGQRAMI